MNAKKLSKFSSIIVMVFFATLSFGKIAYADPTFSVVTSTVGQVTFSGQGLMGMSAVDIVVTKNSTGEPQLFSASIVSNSFSGVQVSVTPGENYSYIISNADNSDILKSGTFAAASSSSGTNTGGGSGTNTGSGGSGTNTGGGSGTNTGGSSGTNTGGSSGTNTGGGSGTNTGGSSGTNTGAGSGTNTGGTSLSDITLENPLKNIDSIPKFVEAILNIVFTVGSWILALFIIYVGYKFVAARGNDKELAEAKEALKYTLIGGVILLGAWVIAEAIVGTVNALK